MSDDAGGDTATIYLTELDVAIIGDVIGHPYELPTVPELVYMQSAPEGRIERRLPTLYSRGLLKEHHFETEPPAPDQPQHFVGVTDRGRQLFFERIPDSFHETLKTAYAQVQKPAHIKALKRAPRPPR